MLNRGTDILIEWVGAREAASRGKRAAVVRAGRKIPDHPVAPPVEGGCFSDMEQFLDCVFGNLIPRPRKNKWSFMDEFLTRVQSVRS